MIECKHGVNPDYCIVCYEEPTAGRGGGVNMCTCTKDKEITCIVHPTKRSLKERIAELEAENQRLTDKIEGLEKTLKLWRAGWRTGDAEDFLEEAVIKAGLHRQSPCVLCGYNGPEYYQPETHKCAALNGEVGDEL